MPSFYKLLRAQRRGRLEPKQRSTIVLLQETGVLDTLRGRVHHAVRDAGDHGITCNEIAHTLGLQDNVVSPRLRELELDGHIYRGEKRKSTVSHFENIVWRAHAPRTRQASLEGWAWA